MMKRTVKHLTPDQLSALGDEIVKLFNDKAKALGQEVGKAVWKKLEERGGQAFQEAEGCKIPAYHQTADICLLRTYVESMIISTMTMGICMQSMPKLSDWLEKHKVNHLG